MLMPWWLKKKSRCFLSNMLAEPVGLERDRSPRWNKLQHNFPDGAEGLSERTSGDKNITYLIFIPDKVF